MTIWRSVIQAGPGGHYPKGWDPGIPEGKKWSLCNSDYLGISDFCFYLQNYMSRHALLSSNVVIKHWHALRWCNHEDENVIGVGHWVGDNDIIIYLLLIGYLEEDEIVFAYPSALWTWICQFMTSFKLWVWFFRGLDHVCFGLQPGRPARCAY